jgi:hypothetical protein
MARAFLFFGVVTKAKSTANISQGTLRTRTAFFPISDTAPHECEQLVWFIGGRRQSTGDRVPSCEREKTETPLAALRVSLRLFRTVARHWNLFR